MSDSSFEIWRLFPITIEILHENQIDCLIIEGVMLVDFGPWKQGDKTCLTFDLMTGTVTEYSLDGDESAEVMLKLLEAE